MRKNIKILPSLASANQMCLGRQIEELGEYPFLHIDIEDGNFVPNITFGMKTVREIAKLSGRQMDAHLMVTNPMDYIAELAEAGVKNIAFHVEAAGYPAKCLQAIKERGIRAGIAFNFMAQPEMILPYIDEVDYVLFMTSEPDGQGQRFNGRILEKIERARRIFPERISIIADGGVSEENMKEVVRRGADTLVMGRAVWEAPDAGEQTKRLLEILNDASAEHEKIRRHHGVKGF